MFAREHGEPGTSALKAFDRLERALVSLRGRRFYGIFDPRTSEYRACVARCEGDDPNSLGLEHATIPGGVYVRRRLRGPHSETTPKIPSTLVELSAGAEADTSRPPIEFYRSENEIVLLFPVT